jgi:hypothetical protein
MRNSFSQNGFSMSPATAPTTVGRNRNVDMADHMQHFDPEEIYGSDDSHDDQEMSAPTAEVSLFVEH